MIDEDASSVAPPQPQSCRAGFVDEDGGMIAPPQPQPYEAGLAPEFGVAPGVTFACHRADGTEIKTIVVQQPE